MQDIQSLMDSRRNYQGNIRVDSAWCSVLFPVFVTLGLLLGCTANTAAPPPPSGVPVVVARVSQKLMPVEVSSVGNVEPISTVAVKAQISAELLEVHFKEGDFVRKGQLLFTLDSRIPQGQVGTAQANIEKDQAQLRQVEANLARDTAQLEYAQAESRRFASLMQRGLIAAAEADQARAQASA